MLSFKQTASRFRNSQDTAAGFETHASAQWHG